MLDKKIANGTIVDGTGRAAFAGDIGIRDGRIVAVGHVNEAAHETLDAAGMIVSPGFIDVHTHYDAQAFWDPTFSPSCYHGVTTVVGGFCGFSIAPLTSEASDYLLPMLARVEGMPQETLRAGVPWDWSSFDDFLTRLEGTVGLNCGFFVGHSCVRRVVMGERAVGEVASSHDIARMRELVDVSLREGALGFSTTVSPTHNDADGNPVPSRFATREEILELASAVRDHPGTSLEILPSLDFDQETLDLLTDFSLAGQCAVNWNLLSIQGAGEQDQAGLHRMLNAGSYARERGGEVVALTLPSSPSVRINFMTGFILDSLPGWSAFFQLPPEVRLRKLHDPEERARLKASAETQTGIMSMFTDWGSFRVLEGMSETTRRFQGKLVSEAASELDVEPFDAMIDMVVADGLLTSFQPAIKGEDDATYALRGELWQDDRIIIGGSDAGAHTDMIDSFAFSTKLLQRSRDYDLLGLEQTVHLITQVPAEYFGLRERGVLAPGYHADVVIFDKDSIASGDVYTRYDLPGTTEKGRLYAEAIGIAAVMVNGEVLIRDNQVTQARPGRVLRSGRDTQAVAVPRVREPA